MIPPDHNLKVSEQYFNSFSSETVRKFRISTSLYEDFSAMVIQPIQKKLKPSTRPRNFSSLNSTKMTKFSEKLVVKTNWKKKLYIFYKFQNQARTQNPNAFEFYESKDPELVFEFLNTEKLAPNRRIRSFSSWFYVIFALFANFTRISRFFHNWVSSKIWRPNKS